MRNEREDEKANCMGRTGGGRSDGGGGSYGAWKPKVATAMRQPSGAKSKIRYCCDRSGHFARECPMKKNSSYMKDHLANMCRKGGSGASSSGSNDSRGGGSAKLPVLATKPELGFAKGVKRESAKERAEGMVVEKVLLISVGGHPLEDVEWPGYFGASRHVCNDMSLLWDVNVREEPMWEDILTSSSNTTQSGSL